MRDHPTPFRDLNALLDDFVASTRSILGSSFCAAYLQGSFALGDADPYSDVDFIVVIEAEVGTEQTAALQQMHAQIYRLETPWAQHLEGSYAPRRHLRRTDTSRSPFLFLDNGASELVWDSHCNTALVRWILREHGVVLAGPAPTALVDPVCASDLRAEALWAVDEYAEWAPEPTKAGGMSRWKQPYLVVTFCRLLHTLDTGTVASKRKAGEWALGALAPEWSDLIARALADRPDPWARVYQLAEPVTIERTLQFVEYARDRAALSAVR